MRIEGGRPVAHVADETSISRPTAYKWWRRWREEGELGLVDRSRRAQRRSHQTPSDIEAQIAELRQTLKPGPTHWLPPGRGTLDGTPGADPPGHQSREVDGPAHRAGDPPLRARTSR